MAYRRGRSRGRRGRSRRGRGGYRIKRRVNLRRGGQML